MANDSIGKTITVAVLLCIVCSVLVSTAAVKLKPLQDRNKALSTKANILIAADLMSAAGNVDELFKKIEVRYVNLSSGRYDETVDPKKYNRKKYLKDSRLSWVIPKSKDLAKIGRRVKTAPVYLVKEEGKLKTIILPIHGKGLWSTMYAFLALEGDANTVKGYTFYDHGETPGLGGEVDNPLWQKQWVGKKLFDQDWTLAIDILKGKVNLERPEAIHQADGLSGATLTTLGVENLMHYWLGEDGFGNYLAWIRTEGGKMAKISNVLFDPIFNNNPIALQILGICSALAVTSKLDTVVAMSCALMFVTSLSNLSVSLIRNHIPMSIRIIVQMTIIASLVIIVDQFLKAFAFDISKRLSVYVGLIITNCIVMGRAEAFAMKNSPLLSFLDGLGNALGYALILFLVGFVRELLGTGKLLGYNILTPITEGDGIQPMDFYYYPPVHFS